MVFDLNVRNCDRVLECCQPLDHLIGTQYANFRLNPEPKVKIFFIPYMRHGAS